MSWDGSIPAVKGSFFCNNQPEHIASNWDDRHGNAFSDYCPELLVQPDPLIADQDATFTCANGKPLVTT